MQRTPKERRALLAEYDDIQRQIKHDLQQYHLTLDDLELFGDVGQRLQALFRDKHDAIEQVRAELAALSEADEPQVIGRQEFISAAIHFFEPMMSSGNYFGVNDIEHVADAYTLDSTLLAQRLGAMGATTPLGKELLLVLQKNAAKLTTVAKVKRAFHNIATRYSDRAVLGPHYDRYAKVYKKKAAGSSDDLLELEELFIGVLKGDLDQFSKSFPDIVQSAINDPAYAPNAERAQEKAEQAVEKEELATEQALNRMRDKWDEWLQSTVQNIEEPDTALDGKTLDLNALEQNRRYLKSPAYARDFWTQTTQDIQEAIKSTAPIGYTNATDIAMDVLSKRYNAVIDDAFIYKAIASEESNMPSGLKKWLAQSIDPNTTLHDQFTTLVRAWIGKVTKLTGTAEGARNNNAFTVDAQQWTAHLEELLVGPAHLLIVPLTKGLPQGPNYSLRELHQAWTDGLAEIQSEAVLDAMWTELLEQTSDGKTTEAALQAFYSKLPAVEVLEQRLIDSRYVPTKERFPTIAQSLVGTVRIEAADSSDQDWIQIAYTCPLAYQRVDMGNHKVPYPIVQAAGVQLQLTKSGKYKAQLQGQPTLTALTSNPSTQEVYYQLVVQVAISDTTKISRSNTTTEGGTSLSGGVGKGASAQVTVSSDTEASTRGSSQATGIDTTLTVVVDFLAQPRSKERYLVRSFGAKLDAPSTKTTNLQATTAPDEGFLIPIPPH